MAYDLVTWAPRIGATGDDKYNVPANTRIAVGSSAGYSTTPTIAEINAGSGLNQVVAAARRRIRLYNSAFGTAVAEPSYIDATTAGRINGNDFSVKQAIDDLRTAEGFAAYSWPSSYTTNARIVSQDLAQLRKALAIDGTLTLGSVFGTYTESGYNRDDSPYGTPASEAFSGSFMPAQIGKLGVAGTVTRHRYLKHFNIPEWLSACSAADFKVRPSTHSSTELLTAEVRFSNTDDSTDSLTPAYGGTAYNGVNSIGVFDHTLWGTIITISMTTSWITGAAGRRLSTTFFTDQERNGTGTGGNVANHYTINLAQVVITF